MKGQECYEKKTNKTGSSIKKVALGLVGALAYEFLGQTVKNQKKVMNLVKIKERCSGRIEKK